MRPPSENRLLALLPKRERDGLLPSMQPVTLRFGDVLYEPDGVIRDRAAACNAVKFTFGDAPVLALRTPTRFPPLLFDLMPIFFRLVKKATQKLFELIFAFGYFAEIASAASLLFTFGFF